MIEKVAEKKGLSKISRRGFIKTMAAIGVAGGFVGCSKDGESVIYQTTDQGIPKPELKMNDWYYGTGGHNCHAKCASKIWVNEGRIIRVTSPSEDARPGYDYDSDKPNGMQLACGKCRAYKYRLTHPGRLKYPLKQTKDRGDLSGFVRVSWDQALNEIARKHRAIYEKYGPEAMFIPCGSGAEGIGEQGGGYSGTLWGNSGYTGVPLVLRYLGGVQQFGGDVSYIQMYNWTQAYVGIPSVATPSAANMASGKIKNLISFGENSMTTEHNTRQTKQAAYALARKNGTKITYIAPEFVGEGMNIADEFIPTKPGTTAALMIGMLHEMLINTFNPDGSIRTGGAPGSNRTTAPWLDVEYIDLCVYGFFDSPEYTLRSGNLARGYYEGTDNNRGTEVAAASHPNTAELSANGAVLVNKWKRERIDLWIHTTSGAVVKTKPTSNIGDYTYQAYRWQSVTASATFSYTNPARTVNAVPAGMSWSAYIIGDEGGGTNRLMKAKYSDSKNYLARAFAPHQAYRNMDLCNQPVAQGANTAFIRKKEYRTPKTAEWASKITGIPAQRIKDLAWMYCNPAEHPIYHNRGNGLTKQIDGLMAMQVLAAFFAVTKTVGMGLHGMNFGSTSSFGISAVAGAAGSRVAAMPTYTATRSTTTPITPIATNGASFGSPLLAGTQWPNAVKMAFMDVMLDPAKGKGAYTAKYIPDYKPTPDFKSLAESKDLANWKSYVGRVYQDYGAAKGLVKLERLDGSSNTALPYSGNAQNEGGTGMRLYQTSSSKPIYSGFRWIAMISANSMNQTMNPNDTAEMLESIPSCGQTNDPDNPDDLCIFSFDNFLQATARWSDYVLPGQTQWEMATRTSANGQTILMPGIVEAPGESKDTFDFSVAFLRAYEKAVPTMAGMANQFTGHDNVTGNNTPIPGDRLIDKYKRAYDRALMGGTAGGFGEGGRYRGKTFEEALKVQYELPIPPAFTVGDPPITESAPRSTCNIHTAGLRDGTTPPGTIFYPNITTTQTWVGSVGFAAANMLYATSTAEYPVPPCPSDQSGRYHVYSEVLPWLYSKNYEGFHTHLRDAGLPIGQRPDDIEGDPIVPVIPMYFNYEDSFMDAYGGPQALQNMPENTRFVITSAHPVLRAHSTHGEIPLVRELTTRVRGGGEHSGNDWGTFALSDIGKDGKIPRVNSAIDSANNFQKTDFKRASWLEALMNVKDGERLGIKDGNIIELRNPIGAVRVAVKLTRRVAKGTIALEQGGWYDPDPIDGVDDGGCVNTLMAAKGSWLDNGNGCSFAMVSVKKVL